MFATIFFGILDTCTGVFTYINGGHLPPLLIKKNGAKEILTLTGPGVGASSDAEYAIRKVQVEPGDTFFACTDGLTETENTAGETFSMEELIPILVLDQTLSSLLSQIQERMKRFSSGAQQLDDITMLSFRRGIP